MNSTLLLTRPDHDRGTKYLYHWSKYVIETAASKGLKVLDLERKKATRVFFNSYIKKNNPRLIFLNGHGGKDCVCGYDNEIILDKKNCKDLLKEKILYVRSCEAGSFLGPLTIQEGATAFVGYSNKYWLIRSPEKNTKPLDDKIAKLFLEPSNQVPISLIKGNTVRSSFEKSQKDMYRNFNYMISSKATTEERDAAFFLYANFSCQVMFGDVEAKI